MMRLIDADRLSEAIWDNVSAPYEDASWAKENCLAEIEAAPTVDAVKITRCRDCESARELTQHESIYLADGVLICTNCEVSEDCRLPVWPQHFCGYGRQKDGGEDDAVETVPVVRCENCLYWVSGENNCESWEWCKMLNTDMPPNGFCYLGDRKEAQSDAK